MCTEAIWFGKDERANPFLTNAMFAQRPHTEIDSFTASMLSPDMTTKLSVLRKGCPKDCQPLAKTVQKLVKTDQL